MLGCAEGSTVVEPVAPDVAVLTAALLSWLPTVHQIYEQLETIMAMRVLSRPERSSSSDDRCLSLGPLRSKCKLKTNGLSYGTPYPAPPRSLGTHVSVHVCGDAANTGNHQIRLENVRSNIR